jgi:hypothetical protein
VLFRDIAPLLAIDLARAVPDIDRAAAMRVWRQLRLFELFMSYA